MEPNNTVDETPEAVAYSWMNEGDIAEVEAEGRFCEAVFNFIKDRTDLSDEMKHSLMYVDRGEKEFLLCDYEEMSVDGSNASIGDGHSLYAYTQSSIDPTIMVGCSGYYSSWNGTDLEYDMGFIKLKEEKVMIPELVRDLSK